MARIIFGPRSSLPDAIQATENGAVKVLQLLPVTPIKAAGINFGFVEETVSIDLAQASKHIPESAERADELGGRLEWLWGQPLTARQTGLMP